jgi:hypothetical protein
MEHVRCNVQHSSSRVSTLGAKQSSASGSAVPENRSKVRNSQKKGTSYEQNLLWKLEPEPEPAPAPAAAVEDLKGDEEA